MSLSSRSSPFPPPLPLAPPWIIVRLPSLSLPPFTPFVPTRLLPPCKSFVLFLLHHHRRHHRHHHHHRRCRVKSYLPSSFLLSVSSLFLALSLSLASKMRARTHICSLARTLSLSLLFSRFRAGLGAANYPGHRYFLPRIKTDNRIITKIKVLNFVTFPLIKEVTIKQTCRSLIARINEACGWISVFRINDSLIRRGRATSKDPLSDLLARKFSVIPTRFSRHE